MDVKPSLLPRARTLIACLGACLLLVESVRTLLSWLRSHRWPWKQNPGLAQTAGSHAVALLIDAENFASIPIERVVEFALNEAQKLGDVTIRRIYSNCSLFNSPYNNLNDTCLRLDFEQVHLTKPTPNKNAADITLSIDAVTLAVEGRCNRFCIVTSDSDFTPLVRRLRVLKCQVLGIGKKQASKTLITACNSFVFLDNEIDAIPSTLTRRPAPAPRKQTLSTPPPARPTNMPSTENQPPPSPQPEQQPGGAPAGTQVETATPLAVTILTRAYLDASHGRTGEWVLLSRLGLSLRQLYPDFKATAYAEDLSALIRHYPNVFDFEKRPNGHPQMRLKA